MGPGDVPTGVDTRMPDFSKIDPSKVSIGYQGPTGIGGMPQPGPSMGGEQEQARQLQMLQQQKQQQLTQRRMAQQQPQIPEWYRNRGKFSGGVSNQQKYGY